MTIDAGFLEKHWSITDVSIGRTLKKTEGGRQVVTFNAREGAFVCRIPDPSKKADTLERELSIFDFLHQRGFHAIPSLLKTKAGESYRVEDSTFVYVMSYISGEHPPKEPDTYRKLGRLVAQLHGVKGYPHLSDYDANYIVEHDLPDRAGDLPFKDEYLTLVQALPKFNGLPKTLIHTDVGPQNAIQEADGSLVLIDWDDVGLGPAVLDIGYVSTFQQFMFDDGRFSYDNARAFFEGYSAKRDLTGEERARIFDAGLFVALDYIIYGDAKKRWGSIQWMLAHRDDIERLWL